MSVSPDDPHAVIDAAQLAAANPSRVSEPRLQEALHHVRERKRAEHGAWRDAELAILAALGARRHVTTIITEGI